MLAIKAMIEGKCSLCQKETEVVQAKFADGLEGLFCRSHFWEAAKARSEIQKEKKNREKEPEVTDAASEGRRQAAGA